MKQIISDIFSKNSKNHPMPLIVFEIANNHMGNVNHGLKIIRELSAIAEKFPFTYGFKLQLRDLDSFIHPDFKNRSDMKYVKRFTETKLSESEFRILKKEIIKRGHLAICTPFDEVSVDVLERLNFDIIKIASCSFTDWPLLEKIALTDTPIIASTAGISLKDIDKVVSFFQHRKKKLILMHCVAAYPTKSEELELNQIDLLKDRYPDVNLGYSTHEEPNNFIAGMLAATKGTRVFEKHVGIKSKEYALNQYSATPHQVKKWLESIEVALKMSGVVGARASFSKKELIDLQQFKRGLYAKKRIAIGDKVNASNTFFAFPNMKNQILANDFSKYAEFTMVKTVEKNQPIFSDSVKKVDNRLDVDSAVILAQKMLKKSKIALPAKLDFELSHHYGISLFRQYGATIIDIINRNYCKKIVVLFPKQIHPVHYHKKKEETFHILYGEFTITLNGAKKYLKAGDVLTIESGVKHGFTTKLGGILEEISTTSLASDSYYVDNKINENKYRKTRLTNWVD